MATSGNLMRLVAIWSPYFPSGRTMMSSMGGWE